MAPEFDSPPLAKNDAEKQALAVLDEMSQGKWYLNVTTREGRVLRQLTEAVGAKRVVEITGPVDRKMVVNALNSGADVLVLNHYGRDMVNSLTQAVQFGLRDKQVNGKDFAIVVPLYSRLMAQGAGENVKGIYGSTNWHWSLQDEGSKALVQSFGQKAFVIN